MNVLVDTSIWSLALRRGVPRNRAVVDELTQLIQELRVQVIGPIRQELLSGIKLSRQFTELKSYLAAFPDLPLVTEDFEAAAEYYNLCRAKGIQGSNTDFLICSVAIRHNLEIFTSDQDFIDFQKVVPINLYIPRITQK